MCDNLQGIFANPPSRGIERRRRRRQWALILSRGTNPHNGNGFAQFTRLIVCDLPNSLQPPTTRPTTAEEKGNEFEFVYCLLSEEEVNNYNPIKLSAGTTTTSRRSPREEEHHCQLFLPVTLVGGMQIMETLSARDSKASRCWIVKRI